MTDVAPPPPPDPRAAYVSLLAYVAALGCATYLAARGAMPTEVVAALLGAMIPTGAWMLPKKG